MTVPEQLERAVKRSILLHQQLKDHVTRQKTLFDENRLDDMADEIHKGELIIREIEKANEAVLMLLDSVGRHRDTVDENRRKHLDGLMASLKARVNETMGIIDQAGTMLQLMKRETAEDIRALDTRKRAINSYNRNAVHTNYREMSRR